MFEVEVTEEVGHEVQPLMVLMALWDLDAEPV